MPFSDWKGLMLNERKLGRQQLIYNLSVTNPEQGHLIGNLYDISVEGVQLTHVSCQNFAANVSIDLLLPEAIYGESHLVADVVCRWGHSLGNEIYSSAGFEFSHLSVLEEERIGLLIADYGYPVRARPYRPH